MEKNSSTFPLMLMGVLARAHIDISEDFRRMCHEGGGGMEIEKLSFQFSRHFRQFYALFII